VGLVALRLVVRKRSGKRTALVQVVRVLSKKPEVLKLIGIDSSDCGHEAILAALKRGSVACTNEFLAVVAELQRLEEAVASGLVRGKHRLLQTANKKSDFVHPPSTIPPLLTSSAPRARDEFRPSPIKQHFASSPDLRPSLTDSAPMARDGSRASPIKHHGAPPNLLSFAVQKGSYLGDTANTKFTFASNRTAIGSTFAPNTKDITDCSIQGFTKEFAMSPTRDRRQDASCMCAHADDGLPQIGLRRAGDLPQVAPSPLQHEHVLSGLGAMNAEKEPSLHWGGAQARLPSDVRDTAMIGDIEREGECAPVLCFRQLHAFVHSPHSRQMPI
jgi:hypothetical protein